MRPDPNYLSNFQQPPSASASAIPELSAVGQPQGRLDFSAYASGQPIPQRDLEYTLPTDQKSDPSVMSQFVGTGSPLSSPSIGMLPMLSDINPPVGMGSSDYSSLESDSRIGFFLQPIINMAGRQHAAEHLDKIPTYINEVTEITDRTFPDLFSGSGMGSLGGFFGGGMNQNIYFTPDQNRKLLETIQNNPYQMGIR
jgi:hypothetical protein